MIPSNSVPCLHLVYTLSTPFAEEIAGLNVTRQVKAFRRVYTLGITKGTHFSADADICFLIFSPLFYDVHKTYCCRLDLIMTQMCCVVRYSTSVFPNLFCLALVQKTKKKDLIFYFTIECATRAS